MRNFSDPDFPPHQEPTILKDSPDNRENSLKRDEAQVLTFNKKFKVSRFSLPPGPCNFKL